MRHGALVRARTKSDFFKSIVEYMQYFDGLCNPRRAIDTSITLHTSLSLSLFHTTRAPRVAISFPTAMMKKSKFLFAF